MVSAMLLLLLLLVLLWRLLLVVAGGCCCPRGAAAAATTAWGRCRDDGKKIEQEQKRGGSSTADRSTAAAAFVVVVASSSDALTTHRRCWRRRRRRLPPPRSSGGVVGDDPDEPEQRRTAYEEARRLRIRPADGVSAARPAYRRILLRQQQQRQQKLEGGRDEECGYYRDVTAATRLAASREGQEKLERFGISKSTGRDDAVPVPTTTAAEEVRSFLLDNGFTARGVADRVFGDNESRAERFRYARAPLYLRQAEAGSRSSLEGWPWRRSGAGSSVVLLDLFIALFIVGLAVPKRDLYRAVTESEVLLPRDDDKGNQISKWMMDLFLQECEIDSELLFSIVQITPIDVQGDSTSSSPTNSANTLLMVTDWHPNVLQRTSIGDSVAGIGKEGQQPHHQQEDAVMYIGPDSLALLQNFLLLSSDAENGCPPVWMKGKLVADCHSNIGSQPNDQQQRGCTSILDLCTGSGVQALAAIAIAAQHQHRGKVKAKIKAVCVDLNPRALRFVSWNAAFNGFPDESIILVKGDVAASTGAQWMTSETTSTDAPERQQLLSKILVNMLREDPQDDTCKYYDLITANPPFLPVPPQSLEVAPETDAQKQSLYGSFSDGGSSGEVVLEAIIRLAPQLLNPNAGWLAIVSEFFFEGQTNGGNDGTGAVTKPASTPNYQLLLDRIESWWCNPSQPVESSASTASARAVLFTNQFPLDAASYAERRSFADSENSGNSSSKDDDKSTWLEHLRAQNIGFSSPGLLYVQTTEDNVAHSGTRTTDSNASRFFDVTHSIVPRSSKYGSVWTPSNPYAAEYIRNVVVERYYKDDPPSESSSRRSS